MVEYSEDYQAHAEADGTSDSWQTDSRQEFVVGISPEFDGEFDGPAPENYYVVALTNCYIATFVRMADNSDLEYEKIVADGTLKLRPDDGTTVVDSFDLDIALHVETETRKTEVILERVPEYCFILQSVDFDINLEYRTVN